MIRATIATNRSPSTRARSRWRPVTTRPAADASPPQEDGDERADDDLQDVDLGAVHATGSASR